MKEDRGAKVVAWKDVIRVEAFKRDLYVVDLICLKFLSEDNTTIEIDEEMDGWQSLIENLHEYLPGCQNFSEWFGAVALPAFKTNFRVIYRSDVKSTPRKVLIT
ncbi:MAG TPA: hypothetical protein VF074_18065 [Pyrinomonadaceae bacterium]